MERLKLRVAAYIFFIKDDEILLSRRINSGWQDGNYGVPSGHLEAGEGVMGALLREVKEETGIILNEANVEFVHVMHRNSIYVDFFFVSKNWTGEPTILEKDKCDDMQWFPLRNLPKNIVPSVRLAIEHYQNGVLFSDFLQEG